MRLCQGQVQVNACMTQMCRNTNKETFSDRSTAKLSIILSPYRLVWFTSGKLSVVSLYSTQGFERRARYCVVMLMHNVATRTVLGNLFVCCSWQIMNNGLNDWLQ